MDLQIVDGYFIHFFAPSSLPSLPKHVVFVLDTSGSMEGTKLEQTKQAMDSILDQLHADDLFSVIEFSSTAQVCCDVALNRPTKVSPTEFNWNFLRTGMGSGQGVPTS